MSKSYKHYINNPDDLNKYLSSRFKVNFVATMTFLSLLFVIILLSLPSLSKNDVGTIGVMGFSYLFISWLTFDDLNKTIRKITWNENNCEIETMFSKSIYSRESQLNLKRNHFYCVELDNKVYYVNSIKDAAIVRLLIREIFASNLDNQEFHYLGLMSER